MLPLTIGFLIAGPTAGFLSDRYGARPFADRRDARLALGFRACSPAADRLLLPRSRAILLPHRPLMGAFASPNRASVMNSLPAEDRGAGGGMNQTFQNSAQVLSIGIFFTLMIVGLSASLPDALASGLEAHGVAGDRPQVGAPPPVSILFAAFLGYNPAQDARWARSS